MKRLLLLCVACAPPPAVYEVPVVEETTLALTLDGCKTIEIGAQVVLSLSTAAESLPVAIELTAADGRTVVLERPLLSAAASYAVSVADLPLGDNVIRAFSDDDHRPSALAAVTVRVAAVMSADAPAQDVDGDCYTQRMGDCRDDDVTANPAMVEVCGDGLDTDCNGVADLDEPTCIVQCEDKDGDGAKNVACGGLDCDDDDAMVLPNRGELCNNRDDDCDGLIDEDFDLDGDGFLACPNAHVRRDGSACPDGFAECVDCNDHNPTVYPGPHGTHTGTCGNGRIDAGEECDDNNAASGDGCDAACIVECPAGDGVTTHGEKDANHRCLYITVDLQLREQSLATCRALGGGRGGFAVLPTLDEMNFVFGKNAFDDLLAGLPQAYLGVWLGASDRSREGTYVWSTGQTFTPVGAYDWGSEEPDGGLNPDGTEIAPDKNQDCLMIIRNERWADRSCVGDVGGALCELRAPQPSCP